MRRILWALALCALSVGARNWDRCKPLVVGFRTDNPPFGYNKLDAQRPGIEYDLVAAIARYHNRSFTVREISSQREGEDLLDRDQIDLLIGSIKNTPELRGRFNTSTPYFRTGLGIVVLRANQNVFTLGDLNGKGVAATSASNAANLIETFIPQAKLEIASSSSEGLAMLQRGEVEGMVHDRSTLQSEVSRNSSLRLLDVNLSEDNYVIATNKTRSTGVLENVNTALAKVMEARGSEVSQLAGILAKYKLGYTVRTPGPTPNPNPNPRPNPTPAPNPNPNGNTASPPPTGGALDERVRILEAQVQELQRTIQEIKRRL